MGDGILIEVPVIEGEGDGAAILNIRVADVMFAQICELLAEDRHAMRHAIQQLAGISGIRQDVMIGEDALAAFVEQRKQRGDAGVMAEPGHDMPQHGLHAGVCMNGRTLVPLLLLCWVHKYTGSQFKDQSSK